jgi:Fe-S cluster biogenesis protein NfuA
MENVVARLKRTLDERVRPLLLDRGGDLKFMEFSDGILTLSVEGSPGAAMPIRGNVANLIMRYAPEVREVRLVAGRAGESAPAASLHDAVRRVVDEQINPAVAAHGGFVRLVEVAADTVFIRFEGGCQGCAMAHVTLCQGVEVMIKEQVRGVTAVVDVTDHEGGTQPYFKTRKT